jgi:two-component system nitrate/nitrite response regulator NarL
MEDPLTHQTLFPIKLLLCCGEPVCALGLRVVLEGAGARVRIVPESGAEPAQMAAVAADYGPQVVVYDLGLEPGLPAIAELRRALPHVEIVLWAREFSAEQARQAISMGARGFLTAGAPPETILECLTSVTSGEMWMERALSNRLLNTEPLRLSPRQSELLGLLMQGLKNREIAESMGIAEGTVKAYLTTLFEKVGARDRFELALFGLGKLRSASADGPREAHARTHLRPRAARHVGAVA